MGNSFENREIFFQQYHGQNILIRNDEIDQYLEPITNSYFNSSGWGKAKLLLKHIPSMSYMEASNMVERLGITIGKHENDDFLSIEDYIKYLDAFSDDLSSYQVDLLRINGFAVDYMGLSVEKQIEYGWIKLITN